VLQCGVVAQSDTLPLDYEQRCLVFVDILGWSAMVRRSATDAAVRSDVTKAYRRLLDTTRFIQSIEATDPRKENGWAATLLSDSLALSCRPADAASLLDHVASDFAYLLVRLGIYVRGAVVLGDLYHRANVIIGPALVQAVELEKAACYPRVIVDESATGAVPDAMTLPDFDGVPVLDYLAFAFQNGGQVVTNMQRAREVIEAKLAKDAADPKLAAKHRWLLRHVQDLEDAARSEGAAP
jgi:hypothetical protein